MSSQVRLQPRLLRSTDRCGPTAGARRAGAAATGVLAVLGVLGCFSVLVTPAAGADAKAGQAAVRQACSGCHHETSPGHFDRISDIRETPEGWSMTIFRMRQVHGLQIDDAARDAVIRYLAAVNGLCNPNFIRAGQVLWLD